ncbi:hypothetical protein ACA910_012777 [Epithemia clementina (nom. ined.)]
MLQSVDNDTWSADNNFGEMFLDFWLHPKLQSYPGIDLTLLFKDELKLDSVKQTAKKTLWEAWTRWTMGLTSTYQATQNGAMSETSCPWGLS